MANFSAQDVKALREKTGAGMMDCKKALTENDSMEDAVDWLRKKGLSAAAKKSGRTAAEGLVAIAVSGNKAAVIELNSETDFVAKNEKFQQLAQRIATIAVDHGATVEELKETVNAETGRSVKDDVVDLVGSIGENLQLRRSAVVSGDVVVPYIHNAVKDGIGKIGVLVALKTTGNKDKAQELGKQIAMHIAAARPESLNVAGLDQSLVAREKDVLTEQARASGKPDNVIEKMIEGRIRKFYAEVVLLEQAFVMDGKTAVKDILKDAEKEIGAPVEIVDYQRFQLGEGIEKEESNFADEVAAAAGK